MVGPLKEGSHKKKYLLVMVDKFTKWIEAKPIKTDESGPVIDFISGVIHRYGVPHNIITDNGSNFTADEVKTWCANLGIKLDYSSAYHLQTNDQIERANGLIMSGIKPRLVRSLKESDKHWVEELNSVLWGCGPRPIALLDTHLSSWCTTQRQCYRATLFMTHLECACMRKEKPSWIGRTAWTHWRKNVTSRRLVPHSISNRPEDTKAEKYGPRLTTLAN